MRKSFRCRRSDGYCTTSACCYYQAEWDPLYNIISEKYGCTSNETCPGFKTSSRRQGLSWCMPLWDKVNNTIECFCQSVKCNNNSSETVRVQLENRKLSLHYAPSQGMKRAEKEAIDNYLLLLAAFAVCFVCLMLWWTRRRKVDGEQLDSEDLKRATASTNTPLVLRQKTCGDDLIIYDNYILGKGSFGTVFKGKFVDQVVAVKIFEPQRLKAFSNEKAFYQCHGINVRPDTVLRFLFADRKVIDGIEKYVLISEYCDEGSLSKMLKEGTLGLQMSLVLCRDLVSGMDYLHRPRYAMDGAVKPAIAHRDLKSSNIFVKRKQRPYLVIGDFGLALKDLSRVNNNESCNDSCASHSNASTFKTTLDSKQRFFNDDIVVGTVRYHSPEKLSCTMKHLDFHAHLQADIYAMALVLWEIRRRTTINENAIRSSEHVVPYQYPYEEYETGRRGSSAQRNFLWNIVVNQKKRPTFPDNYGNQILKALEELINECWAQNPDARLEARYCCNKIDQLLENLG